MPNKKTNKKAPQKKSSSAKGVFSKVIKALKPSAAKTSAKTVVPKHSKPISKKVQSKQVIVKNAPKGAKNIPHKGAQSKAIPHGKQPQKVGKDSKNSKNAAPQISKKSKGFQKLETLKHKPVAPQHAAKGKAAPVVAAPAAKPQGKTPKGKAGKVIAIDSAPKKAAINPAVARALLREKKRCREPGCEHDFTMANYCRLHYIKNWRKIKRKEAILASGQLENYVEELVSKYPDKYLDVIQQDLSSEKDWAKVVLDLELESPDDEFVGEEDSESFAEGTSRRERDFEDEEPESF